MILILVHLFYWKRPEKPSNSIRKVFAVLFHETISWPDKFELFLELPFLSYLQMISGKLFTFSPVIKRNISPSY